MEKLHCRDISLQANEPMLGTASTHERYLLIEVRFPWKHDILESRDAARFRHVLDALPVKTLFIGADAAYSRAGYRNVVLLQKNGLRYDIREFLVPEGREAEILPQLVEGTATPYTTHDTHRHILVCIDGGHDYCCGRWGQPCYDRLRADFTEQDVRVWRCSHIGGHRFAPTLIDFPEGRYYGRLDDDAAGLLRKTRPFALSMYRGNGCLPREEQETEGKRLADQGWPTV